MCANEKRSQDSEVIADVQISTKESLVRLALRVFHPSPIVRRSGYVIKTHGSSQWIARKLIIRGTYEPDVLALIARLLKPGDTAVDIGANIGWHTLHMSAATELFAEVSDAD